ncbi:hypothetical protein TcasGA2_TC016138 [Tribolium castaneum]|uniref:Uncharacterized protein n=1 Tax=Tribolium castaneum TaxID=7070 RepID=D7GY74_TRICA|nr:hypothetical protein TcasGA2_TC016138 [Tribolium castaneum]
MCRDQTILTPCCCEEDLFFPHVHVYDVEKEMWNDYAWCDVSGRDEICGLSVPNGVNAFRGRICLDGFVYERPCWRQK